jgi:hypothetical protein
MIACTLPDQIIARRKPNAPNATAEHAMPTTASRWAALSSGQWGLKLRHSREVQEADMLEATAEIILTKQGFGVGVGVKVVTAMQVSGPG